MKATCLRAGRENGAPHRLDLKTKDLYRGQTAVFGFQIMTPRVRRRSPADAGFHGDCCDRLALVGVSLARQAIALAHRRAVKGGSPLERGRTLGTLCDP